MVLLLLLCLCEYYSFGSSVKHPMFILIKKEKEKRKEERSWKIRIFLNESEPEFEMEQFGYASFSVKFRSYNLGTSCANKVNSIWNRLYFYTCAPFHQTLKLI